MSSVAKIGSGKRPVIFFLSFLLIVATLLSCCGNLFTVSAATTKYKKFFAFGDSVSHGTAIADKTKAWPELVQKQLSIGTYYDYCLPSERTTEARMMLGDETQYDTEYYSLTGTWSKQALALSQKSATILKQMKAADLISIELGICDYMWYGAAMTSELATKAVESPTPLNIANYIAKLTKYMAEGYANFLTNYPALIEKIQSEKVGQSYTLVIVGTYNVFSQMTLTDSLSVPVANLFGLYADQMNVQFKKWAEEYGAIYVDISNVETGGMNKSYSLFELSDDGSLEFIFSDDAKGSEATHPSIAGQEYISRQFINALNGTTSTAGKITVDLGLPSGAKVSSVILGVKSLSSSEYSYSSSKRTLTIAYDGSALLLRLTVTATRSDGKTSLASYLLTRQSDDSYKARTTYSSSDISQSGILSKAVLYSVKSYLSIVKSAVSKLS